MHTREEGGKSLKITASQLRIDEVENIVDKGFKVAIDSELNNKVEAAYKFLSEFTKEKIIYGVNTGFGPMAQRRIRKEDRLSLQYNLIRSHSSGAGKPIPLRCVKAGLVARLRNFSLGYSGVHPDLIALLQTLINHNIMPVIPEHGGVGASGDLVQLSHLALALIGEGEVYFEGKRRETKEVFSQLDIKPLKLHLREGLALINGTSIMSGIGIINIIEAKKAFNWSLLASALLNELVQSFSDHFSPELNQVKKHKGQQIVADAINNITADSKLIKTRQFHNVDKEDIEVFEEKFQEYYSLRCLPQILGPIWETIKNTESVIEDEINSVSDNPVIDVQSKRVYHGGNFHGDYISLEMDKLKIATTKLSMLAERQLNFLMNDKLNNILPPFVNLGTLGLNLGMQGAQFTATSTVAENQTLSNPMYVHSIPNNNDNQDIVSMGTNAAQMTRKVIDNTFQVLAIEFLSIIQAIDYLKYEDKLSKQGKKVYQELRALVPVFSEDKIIYKNLDLVREYLQSKTPNLLK